MVRVVVFGEGVEFSDGPVLVFVINMMVDGRKTIELTS